MATGEKAKAARAKERAAATKEHDRIVRLEVDERLENERRRELDSQGPRQASRRVKPDPNGNIDERMAALLKDHQDMGARPK
jgi:hypothetical protein